MNIFFKYVLTAVTIGVSGTLCAQNPQSRNEANRRSYQVEVKLSTSTPRSPHTFHLGNAMRPDGTTLLCDNKSLLLGGKPILPVMGEIHYARCEAKDWHRELMKMKAGGVTIAASYIFWIHHEEEKGSYNWEGNRNLHRFLKECQKADMPIILRVGPYCHGEVRNGGYPDWVIESGCQTGSTDPKFMKLTGRWYREIYQQVKGMLWKDGGPIVGIQIENECRGPWSYFTALKDSLVADGFDVPLYTRTGWPQMNGRATFGKILPLYGDYADGFWDRKLTDMPGEYRTGFTFKESRLSTVIASESIPDQTDKMESSELSYPYFTCELGGGMMTSYHRRIHIFDKDALALAICKVGSGSNLPGYYMYHGGTNPTGKNSTLNEAQATPATNYNDLPVRTYDFQAPLGEMGQTNASYHWLRRLHSFLADFGEELSSMDPVFPDSNKIKDPLRWAIRTDGKKGYVFVNNYERMAQLSEKQNVRFTLHRTDSTSLIFPESPIRIPDGASFYFPFGLETCGISIEYATAQPVMILRGKEPTLVFAAIKGIPVEIKMATNGKILKVKDFPRLIDIPTSGQQKAHILVLDEQASLQATKVNGKEQDYLVLSDATVWQEDRQLFLEQWGQNKFQWSVYPADKLLTGTNKKMTYPNNFRQFTDSVPTIETSATLRLIPTRKATAPRQVKNGAQNVAEQPNTKDFEGAAEWELQGVEQIKDPDNTFISLSYEGDVARVYADEELIEDNFYNGKPMLIRASHLVGKHVTVRILPFNKDYPIYLQPEQRMKLEKHGTLLQVSVPKVIIRHTYQSISPIL